MPRSVPTCLSPYRRAVMKYAAAAGWALFCPASLRPGLAGEEAQPRADDVAAGVLRLDLRHVITNGDEGFTLQRLRLEPMGPGPRKRRAERLDWGDYRLSLYDGSDRTLLFRAGFDTPLNANARSGMTEISVRCPMPRRPVHATVEKRRAQSLFQERWQVAIDPSDEGIDRSRNALAGRVDRILSNGSPDTKVDVAVLGDGYQEGEYRKFRDDAARAAGYLFSVEPFRRRARDFNVYSVFVPSADSGVTDPYLGLQRNTVLRCAYQSGESERTLAARDHRAVREVASTVPYDFLLILANSRRYGGSAIFGGPAAVAIDSAAAPYLVIHEFAHVIGGLADEYYIPDAYGPRFAGNVEPWNPNVTIAPEKGKWRPAAGEPTLRSTRWNKSEYEAYFSSYVKRYYALRSSHAEEAAVEKLMHEAGRRTAALLAKNGAQGKVGWFEGANGYAKGAYRAEVDCIMFSFQTHYFCSACSSAIERMIDEHCS